MNTNLIKLLLNLKNASLSKKEIINVKYSKPSLNLVKLLYKEGFIQSFNITKVNLNPALGLNGYTAITEALKTDTPIIGFGGITTKDVAYIVKTGIPGIAISNAISNDFNTIRTFNQLLNASSTDEKRHTFK